MKFETSQWLAAILVSLAAIGLGLAGCSTAKQAGGSASAPATDRNAARPAQTGVQLWAQNCGHCHNIRSPDSYSVTHWDVAMVHMRVRANLTPQEHKAILEFLQSGNRGPGIKKSSALSPLKTARPPINPIDLPLSQSDAAAVGAKGQSSVRAEQP
jgi:hypothetical protein